MRSRLFALLAILTLTAAAILSHRGASPPALAQLPPGTATPGIAPPRPLPPPPPPVVLDRMAAVIDIQDQVAKTTLDLVFKNASDRPQEATLLFPVPPGAAVSDFTMTVNGQTLEGELLGRDEAARIYTGIVQRRRDPALLEYAGQDVLRARLFPVPARDEARLTVRFGQVLTRENGAVRYRLPLTVGEDAGPTVSGFTVSAHVAANEGVRALFSPTHPLRAATGSDGSMSGTYEGTGVALRGAFELDALLASDAVGASMVSYRTPGQDGYFMLWLAPRLSAETVIDKDVILVLDVSGSMSGRKIAQAKDGLRFVLDRLNPGDRFNVVSFSSGVDTFARGLRPASEAGDARRYVDSLDAEGGTNIDEALRTALAMSDPSRLTTVIFLTDGQPTVGEDNPARILANVSAEATPNLRLFVFGVGDDVNTFLLDGLAVDHHGDSAYVRPNEDVEEAVSTLYGHVSAPQLTDIAVDFGDASVYDVYPRPLPDLFGGQSLFVTGRYRIGGPVTVRLAGTSRDGAQTFTFDGMTLTDGDRTAAYLPRSWAQRKIGALMREITLKGAAGSRELIDEVVALGTRYGIVTPYTSFLVQEPGTRAAAPIRTPTAAPTAAPTAGAGAVNAAATAAAFAGAPPAAARPVASTTGGAAPETQVTTVGDKGFVVRGDTWVDTAYQDGMQTVTVTFATDAYFALLQQHPELVPYFALGERVIVVLDGVAYVVTSE